MELDDKSSAISAGTKMLELDMDKSSNELVQNTLASLLRKGWLKTPQEAAAEKAATERSSAAAREGEEAQKRAIEERVQRRNAWWTAKITTDPLSNTDLMDFYRKRLEIVNDGRTLGADFTGNRMVGARQPDRVERHL